MNSESTITTSAPVAVARRIAVHFLEQHEFENTYCNQLAYEALLLLADEIDGVVERVRQVVRRSKIHHDLILDWRDQQFHDLAYSWYRHQDKLEIWRESHLATTEAWMREAPRRPNGALVHDCGLDHPLIGGMDPVGSLLDMQQAYCLRLLRAAQYTNEKRFVEECLLQYRTYRQELRGASGCYHQGKGWLPNDARSPAPWSRGQGWYLHGLIHGLPLLEPWPEAREELRFYTEELLDALQPLQGPSGLWHQLVDQPGDSCPDSSGSALILEAMLLYQKYFSSAAYDAAINAAWNGLSVLVDESGVVDKACKGPGTIWESNPWRNTEAPAGDPHGVFSMLFACAAMA